jgi:hypothetical protein
MGIAAPVAAQSLSPGPPGPYVVDLRGVTSGVPTGPAFYPNTPVETVVPGRGFGVSVGGHVYAGGFSGARLGVGADVMLARGSTTDASSTLRTVSPQLSLNFGSSDGWSYVGVGMGAARLGVEPGEVAATVRTIHFGGGARWFVGPRLGVGFDLRVHRLAAGADTPATTDVTVGVGLSFK